RWRAHSWYISRYPMGREATLSYPALDVRFTNNTAGAVVVKTTYTSGSINVSLYGRPLAETVRAAHGEPTNPTEPTEIRRNTSELSPGRERVIQSGSRGFTVTVTRTVGLIEGGEETQTIRTVYQPKDRIVEVGAG
ncbi:MAG TPA: VanW family protein, partial [Thermoleophilia bacterium]|nr:VanW family protein [Thermoleophilia bacterium]